MSFDKTTPERLLGSRFEVQENFRNYSGTFQSFKGYHDQDCKLVCALFRLSDLNTELPLFQNLEHWKKWI